MGESPLLYNASESILGDERLLPRTIFSTQAVLGCLTE